MKSPFASTQPDLELLKASRFRRMASVGIMCGLLVWSGIAIFLKVVEASCWPLLGPTKPAILWRLGTAPVVEWAVFLEAVGHRVPFSEQILVEATGFDSADEFFLSMWCAYYLPRHDVVRRVNLAAGVELPRYRIRPNGEGSYLGGTSLSSVATKVAPGTGSLRGRVLLEGPGLLLLTPGSGEADQ